MEIENVLDMKLKEISILLCEKQEELEKSIVTLEMKGTNLLTSKRVCLSVILKEIEEWINLAWTVNIVTGKNIVHYLMS